MKHYFKIGSLFHAILLCMGIYCRSSCKDSATDSAAGHNPNQPVGITWVDGSAREIWKICEIL